MGLLRHNMVLFSFLFKYTSQEFVFLTTKLPFYTYCGNQVFLLRTDILTNSERALGPPCWSQWHARATGYGKKLNFLNRIYLPVVLYGRVSQLCVGAAHQKIFLSSTQKAGIRSAKRGPHRARKNPYTGDTAQAEMRHLGTGYNLLFLTNMTFKVN